MDDVKERPHYNLEYAPNLLTLALNERERLRDQVNRINDRLSDLEMFIHIYNELTYTEPHNGLPADG